MANRICINESIYPITYGKSYELVGIDPENPHQIRIIANNARKMWVPAHLFANGETIVPLNRTSHLK